MIPMSDFSNNWIKGNKLGFTDKVLDSLKSAKPLKPRIEFAKSKLQAQNQRLDNMLDRLKSRERIIFNQIISNMQKHDMQQGKILSSELAQIRKTTKTVSQLKLALEQTHMRLESTIDLGDVMSSLGPAMGALSKVKSGVSGLIPEVDSELGEVNQVFMDIVSNAGTIGTSSISFDVSGDDVDNILAEASAIAETRINDSFPDVPASPYKTNGRSRLDGNSA